MSNQSALREQLTTAMIRVFALDRALLKPEEFRIIDELVTAVLGVMLPHGRLLGEQRLAETRAVLDEVLRTFGRFENGPGLVRSGAISVEQFRRWRAVLYPPTPDPAVGPTVAEAAAHDRRWPLEKDGE